VPATPAAREDAERAAQLAPGEVKPLYRLAKACEKAGDALAAREACKRALKLDPDNAQLLQFFKAMPRS
jgi:predicted TPR repeat methyltransferase